MVKIFFLFFVSFLFNQSICASSSEDRIIHEKSQKYPATFGDGECLHVRQLINSPSTFDVWENRLKDYPILKSTENLLSDHLQKKINGSAIWGAQDDVESVYMHESVFSNKTEKKFLHTYSLRDCVGFIAHDEQAKLSCVYHVVAMDVSVGEFERFIKEQFLAEYKGLNPMIYLVSSSYHEHILSMIGIMTKYKLEVSAVNFVAFSSEILAGKSEGTQMDVTTEKIVFDKNRITDTNLFSYTESFKGLPNTAVVIRPEDGAIGIYRS